jgi:hypothetical protein
MFPLRIRYTLPLIEDSKQIYGFEYIGNVSEIVEFSEVQAAGTVTAWKCYPGTSH